MTEGNENSCESCHISQSGTLVGRFAPCDLERSNMAYRGALGLGNEDSIINALLRLCYLIALMFLYQFNWTNMI